MLTKKSTFVLFFGNRGFFPASLQAGARKELSRILRALGHNVLMLNADATRYGAVETIKEGQVFAAFLREHRGDYDGIILSLPNFGDENGAVAALKEADVPILIQAYPDDMDKMGPALRRDAFCGKFSIMDVFYQHGIKYSALKPHTIHPADDNFKRNVEHFDRICRTVKSFKNMVMGAIGARTTAFKTVRYDEVTLQRAGITVETVDLAAGKLKFYLGEGRITEDEIPANFFGCAGVAEIERLQDVLLHVGRHGYRHHVSLTRGHHMAAMREALQTYLDVEVAIPQEA